MMTIKSFKIEKLVRDQIPEIMRESGIKVHERILGDEEFLEKLKEKLLEEAREVSLVENNEELIEELADVLEVVQALANACGINMQQIQKKRIEKREIKGGFDGKIFTHHVEIHENNPLISKYLNDPEKSPQL